MGHFSMEKSVPTGSTLNGNQQREDIEHRVAADLEYINGWSLWLDIKILAKTPLVVIHRNAY